MYLVRLLCHVVTSLLDSEIVCDRTNTIWKSHQVHAWHDTTIAFNRFIYYNLHLVYLLFENPILYVFAPPPNGIIVALLVCVPVSKAEQNKLQTRSLLIYWSSPIMQSNKLANSWCVLPNEKIVPVVVVWTNRHSIICTPLNQTHINVRRPSS